MKTIGGRLLKWQQCDSSRYNLLHPNTMTSWGSQIHGFLVALTYCVVLVQCQCGIVSSQVLTMRIYICKALVLETWPVREPYHIETASLVSCFVWPLLLLHRPIKIVGRTRTLSSLHHVDATLNSKVLIWEHPNLESMRINSKSAKFS